MCTFYQLYTISKPLVDWFKNNVNTMPSYIFGSHNSIHTAYYVLKNTNIYTLIIIILYTHHCYRLHIQIYACTHFHLPFLKIMARDGRPALPPTGLVPKTMQPSENCSKLLHHASKDQY